MDVTPRVVRSAHWGSGRGGGRRDVMQHWGHNTTGGLCHLPLTRCARPTPRMGTQIFFSGHSHGSSLVDPRPRQSTEREGVISPASRSAISAPSPYEGRVPPPPCLSHSWFHQPHNPPTGPSGFRRTFNERVASLSLRCGTVALPSPRIAPRRHHQTTPPPPSTTLRSQWVAVRCRARGRPPLLPDPVRPPPRAPPQQPPGGGNAVLSMSVPPTESLEPVHPRSIACDFRASQIPEGSSLHVSS